MPPEKDAFWRSVEQQIAINQSRTPTERFEALCQLLDEARAMAPQGPEAERRRRAAESVRELEREKLRARFRELIATHGSDAETGA